MDEAREDPNRRITHTTDDFVPLLESNDPVMRRLLEKAKRAALRDAMILLTGESGTGKDVLAHQIHRWSLRAECPFVTVNSSTHSEHLLESELFGHTRGAFDGAIKDEPGRLETGHGGSIFLDAIADLTAPLQTKLLHFIKEQRFEKMGGENTITVDTRIIAASNHDLNSEFAARRFREDLYYRLGVITLRVPALREHPGDVLPLTNRMLAGATDPNDVEAICEAVTRPSMRFVPVKSAAQQDVQALHRVREQLLKSRTALVNQVRGLLGEHGIIAPRGIAHLRRVLSELLADPEGSGLSGLLGETLVEIAGRLRFFDERIRTYDLRIGRVFAHDERCQRLAKVEGVGPLVAIAMVAAVGNAREFKSGRELSAWLGLVPRQHSSGNRNVLLGISKRGDRYLRTLLIHGARSALCRVERRRDRRSIWASRLKLARGFNVAAVALANKNARIIWALLTRGDNYRPAVSADPGNQAA